MIRGNSWTAREDSVLRAQSLPMNYEALSRDHLPGRTPAAIRARACKLGLLDQAIANQVRSARLVLSSRSPIGRARAARTLNAMRERKLSWCPKEWRDTYRTVRRAVRDCAEARAIVEAEIERAAAAERKRIAAMDPFQRQLDRVKAGASVVRRPVLRAPDYSFSITGSSLA